MVKISIIDSIKNLADFQKLGIAKKENFVNRTDIDLGFSSSLTLKNLQKTDKLTLEET